MVVSRKQSCLSLLDVGKNTGELEQHNSKGKGVCPVEP